MLHRTVEFTVEVVRQDRHALLTLRGELDLATVSTFECVAGEVLADSPEDLVIELGRLDFLDLVGARAIVAPCHTVIDRGGTATIRRPSRLAKLVIEHLELDSSCLVLG